LYTIEDQTPTSMFNIADRWVLVARDAFSGIMLWQRELPKWANGVWSESKRSPQALRLSEQLTLGASGILQGGGGRAALRGMVADGDRLFVSLSMREPMVMLDGATGSVLKTFQNVPALEQVVFAEGLLLIADRKNVGAIDPQTGEKRWQAAGSEPSAKDGKAFVVRGGKGILAAVVCLDLKTGRELWTTPCDRAVQATGAKCDAGTAQFAGPLQIGAGIVLATAKDSKRGNATLAVSAADGKPLWHIVFNSGGFARNGGPFIIGDGVWLLQSSAGKVEVLDPRTGRVRSFVDASGIRYVGHHGRCYSSRATSRYIISKERGAEFVDLASGEVNWHNWVRGPCQRGVSCRRQEGLGTRDRHPTCLRWPGRRQRLRVHDNNGWKSLLAWRREMNMRALRERNPSQPAEVNCHVPHEAALNPVSWKEKHHGTAGDGWRGAGTGCEYRPARRDEAQRRRDTAGLLARPSGNCT
jgi:outer membrane protein assembly factor BamB